MSGVLVTIEKDVDVAAETVLSWIHKAETASPSALAAIGLILAALEKPVQDVATAAGTPATVLNVSFDQQTLADIKAVWPAIKSAMASFGVKLP